MRSLEGLPVPRNMVLDGLGQDLVSLIGILRFRFLNLAIAWTIWDGGGVWFDNVFATFFYVFSTF